jgi:hypothetical protein
MYTLDGRMRFQLDLKPEDQLRFHQEKLREIVLSNTGQGYQLAFWFSSDGESNESPSGEVSPDLPEYLIVLPDEAPVQAAIAAAELTAEIAAAHPT